MSKLSNVPLRLFVFGVGLGLSATSSGVGTGSDAVSMSSGCTGGLESQEIQPAAELARRIRAAVARITSVTTRVMVRGRLAPRPADTTRQISCRRYLIVSQPPVIVLLLC